MPTIIACPSCGGKLRVGDALRGQRVRCPACNHNFNSSAEPAAPSAEPQDLPIELSLDEPSSSPHFAPPGGLVGAVELTSAADEPSPAPQAEARPGPRRPRLRDERLEFDMPDLPRLGPRRDTEPDRGAVVLALGIISLAIIVVWCAAPLGAILGLVAWLIGRSDLVKMKRGQMDDTGRGTTQAGLICGIIGLVLNGLITLSCGLIVGSIWFDASTRAPNTTPVPVIRPQAPPPRKLPNKQKPPPINNPPQPKM